MSESISSDTLKSFYDVAKEVLDPAPWDYVEEDEVFAVRLESDGEPDFA